LSSHREKKVIYIKIPITVVQLVEALRYKPEGSIPDGVTGIFDSHNPSGRIMTLGLTHPVTEVPEMSLDGNVGRCVTLTFLSPSYAGAVRTSLESMRQSCSH